VSPPLRLLHTQLIVTSPDQSPPSRSPIKSIRMGPGADCFIGPLSRAHLVLKRAPTRHRPIFVLPRRLFLWPQGKIDSLEGNGGKGRHWLWWPLPDDLEAIGHGFDGRSVMDGCVVHEKVRYFCAYLTKNSKILSC
jgi:hypothetical protein